jgi:hypothetical protein
MISDYEVYPKRKFAINPTHKIYHVSCLLDGYDIKWKHIPIGSAIYTGYKEVIFKCSPDSYKRPGSPPVRNVSENSTAACTVVFFGMCEQSRHETNIVC